MYSRKLLKARRFSKFAPFRQLTLDTKICKKGIAYQNTNDATEKEGECGVGKSGRSSNASFGLSNLWEPAGSGSKSGGNYGKISAAKMGNHTSEKISKDTSELTREEKGVVSSVFARVIEGAGILWIHGCNVDNKICHKDNPYNWGVTNKEVEGKCGIAGGSNHNSSTAKGLSKLWEPSSASNGGGNYDKNDTTRMGVGTSNARISKAKDGKDIYSRNIYNQHKRRICMK